MEGNRGPAEDKFPSDVGHGSSVSTNNTKKAKKISFADDDVCSPVSPVESSSKNKCDPLSETSPSRTTSSSKPEWLEDLDEVQVSMFKQVFEMLDTDGGGSIDAVELFSVMKELDMQISLDEIKSTLRDLDKDGNGEIDFDEFLYCMSETDRYLDMLGGSTDDGTGQPYNKRQTLFFTAITRFAMKNSLGEIERYYANKVRQAPHVISCYTAGARLIGLNDRQLEQEIRRMQKAAKDSNSPYAQPLPFVTLTKRKKKPKPAPPKPKEKPAEPAEAAEPASSDDSIGSDFVPPIMALRQRRQTFVAPDEEMLKLLTELADSGSVVAKIPGIHLVPGIRQKLAHSGEPLCSSMRKKRKQQEQHHRTDKRKHDKKAVVAPGWVIPRVERGQAPLPVIRFARSGKPFTIEDVPGIRKKVSCAMDGYYTELKKAHVKTAYEHWSNLHTDLIRSQKVAEAFQKVYRAYSPHKVQEVFALSPWIPGPRYTSRQPRVVVERSPPPPLPGRARTATHKSSRSSPHPAAAPRSSSSLGHRSNSRNSNRTP